MTEQCGAHCETAICTSEDHRHAHDEDPARDTKRGTSFRDGQKLANGHRIEAPQYGAGSGTLSTQK